MQRLLGVRAVLGAGLAAQLLLLTACIPYTVGSTAQPLPRGENSTSISMFVMPSFALLDSSRSISYLAVDAERRFGIDQRSDAGVRFPSGSGVIVNYKRLLTNPNARTMVAVMPGMGFVNMGDHAHVELTLLVSGQERPRGAQGIDTVFRPRFVPYGGVRAMQVAPLNPDAVHDRPTLGAFIGARIGSVDFGVSPEVGVFYDHSALEVRRGDLVVVPAISFHGQRLIQMLRDAMRGTRIFVMR